MEYRQVFARFFLTVLYMSAIKSTGGQWIFNVTKHPCEHSGALEIICCKANLPNIMLEFRYTDGRLVASTDFNTFQNVNPAFPNYNIKSNTLCATLTASNIVTGSLSFTCTMGSHILTTNVMATCSNSNAGISASQTSNNTNKEYETERKNSAAQTSNNADEGYETERNILIALFCVAVVATIITLAIIKTKCILKSKVKTGDVFTC